MSSRYEFSEIEPRWQAQWAADQIFRVPNPGDPGFDASRPKFYVLDMFPYPSGAGLHVGHPEGYTATDIISRYKRMKGFNVLHPMGWDAFGLPAEQYAIQTGVHPAITTKQSIDNFRRQLQRFGFCYDWSREVGTIDPEYYHWTQWIFLKLYDAWFDDAAQKARPIADLVTLLDRGERPFTLRHGDVTEVERRIGRIPASWRDATAAHRRAVIDSYRLAYLAETTVNWCPKLGTVLANDEVIDGKSERGGYAVLRKPMKQWMFRITEYADRLLRQLDALDWPESTRQMQREWIGRSEGAEIDFELSGIAATRELPGRSTELASLRVFTTRPDTLFGATYMVVAPEHPLCTAILNGAGKSDSESRNKLRTYIAWSRNRSDVERQENKEKSGVFTGVFATNPATGRQIPVWAADYVLMGYGTGAIMAVPAHDDRDHEFATKFSLEIVPVVESTSDEPQSGGSCFSGDGIAVNSANASVSLNGLPTPEAKRRIIDWLQREGVGTHRVNYKLRDWTFSRQRYWGEPFPIVFDAQGNHYPVSANALPIRLPELSDYAPIESDDPQPLLAKARDWVETTAGAAGVDPAILPPETRVRRETNTMPGSAGSSWYFLRYCDPRNDREFASRATTDYWLGHGVDLYIGGAEHAVGHLLYSRFWTNALHDLSFVASPEPFYKLFHQGMITSFAYQRPDRTLVPTDQVEERGDGQFFEIATGTKLTQIVAKMSKTLKNVVNPDDIIHDFGADTFRLYEMYMGPLEASKPWNTRDIVGPHGLLKRIWRLVIAESDTDDRDATTWRLSERISADRPDALERLLHKTIKKIGDDVERLAFNTAIAQMFVFVNEAVKAKSVGRDQLARFLIVLAPFAPHIAEELWHRLGNSGSVCLQPWPSYDEALTRDESIEYAVQINGKIKTRLHIAANADEAAILLAARSDELIARELSGKSMKKEIVVKGRLVNFIVA